MTQNLRVCAICCRREVVYDVISGRNAKNIEGYIVVKFEVSSSNSGGHKTIALSENALAFQLKMVRDGRSNRKLRGTLGWATECTCPMQTQRPAQPATKLNSHKMLSNFRQTTGDTQTMSIARRQEHIATDDQP